MNSTHQEAKLKTLPGPWSLGEMTGNWRDIDLPDHGAVMRIVWKMEDDEGRNEALEAQAHAVVAALNAASHTPMAGQQVIIDFAQVGTAGPFPVVNGHVKLPDATMQDLARMLRPTYEAEQQAAPKAAPGEQNTVPAEWLEQAYREGWAACRDAETIGEEAEDWAFGNSTANSRMIDAQQAAPQQEAHHLTQALTDPENQPNQYGVEFGMSGQQMHFKIGNQLFRLAYEPDDQQEFEFMKRMLIHAFSTFTPDVKAAPQPAPQGETNAQLDTDSNSPTPGQQRDVAGPVAVGQPVGHGSDSKAGDPSAQRNKLLTVAERNIRSFLRSAVFKSESDREAALNCVDVLWEAARAPADSGAAPAATVIKKGVDRQWMSERLGHLPDGIYSLYLAPQQEAQGPSKAYALVYVNKYGVDSIPASKDWCATMVSGHGGSMFPLYTAPQPAPAPLSDDTERLNWLLWKLPGNALRYVVGELSDTSSGAEFRAAIDAALAAQERQP